MLRKVKYLRKQKVKYLRKRAGVPVRSLRRATFLLLASGLAITACKEEEPARLAVETLSLSEVGFSEITAAGNVIPGEEPISAYGFTWSRVPDPDINDDTSVVVAESAPGTGLEAPGEFTAVIGGLLHNTPYYIKAFAMAGGETVYGEQLNARTLQILGVPTVTTQPVTDVTETSFRVSAQLLDDGGSAISEKGFCWDTVPSPTLDGPHRSTTSSSINFSISVSDLEPTLFYHVRAYAVNDSGVGYGNEIRFRTNALPVRDIDGNTYRTVAIGEQVWMAENLGVSRYPDGRPIPLEDIQFNWDTLKPTDPAWTYYNNSTSALSTYGGLYNWPAAMDYEFLDTVPPVQGVCPDGWHLPSDEEWRILERYMGMDGETALSEGWRGTVEGGKLKQAGRAYWTYPNLGATDEYRFTALPAGDILPDGSFFNQRYATFFWTATEYDEEFAWARGMGYRTAALYRGADHSKTYGFSVRCIKDE